MSIAKPTIGRIVHYRDELGAVYPAIVARVQQDVVTVVVFKPEKTGSFHITCDEDSIGSTGEYKGLNETWFWPPRVP